MPDAQRATPGPLVLTTTRSAPTDDRTACGSPRIDFAEIAIALNADLAHPPSESGLGGRIDSALPGGNWRHAWQVRRARPELYLSLSEQIGLPLSFVAPRQIPHLLVAHNLTTKRRRMFERRTRYLERFDRIVVLSRSQQRYLHEETGVSPERIHFVYHNVDTRFFAPSGTNQERGYVLAVGSEQRDYETLLQAVCELAIPTVIVPSSLWNPAIEIARRKLPAFVSIKCGLSFRELRTLYEEASIAIVPLRPDVDYAAGATTVLEAMSMRKPVLVSRTPGLAGYVEDGVSGRLIPPQDPRALAGRIRELMEDPAEARRLAENARAVVQRERDVGSYAEAIAAMARAIA